MRKSVICVISLAFALAPLGFGGTMCNPGTPVSGLATGSCDFYHTPSSYPFDLTSFLTDNGNITLPPNYQVPAYIVFTTDPTEVTNQMYDSSGNPTRADWKDVLFFVNNVVPDSTPTDDLSTQATLYWGGSLPSGSTVDNFLGGGYAIYMMADGSGNYSFDTGLNPNNNNLLRLDFNVHDATVPEPSTFVMIGGAVLALWSVRRRRA